jgi:selenocysteine lyase/cysteine desulfurase
MNKIIYLDAAASYLKSGAVVDAQTQFLRDSYANSGRGVCARAVAVDDMVARVRGKVAGFMGADVPQIVFTNGTTDGMNQIVRMLNLTPDTVVVVSDLDHHSARLPFVMGGAKIEVCPLDGEYNIDVDNIPRGDVLVLTAMSNVMGAA